MKEEYLKIYDTEISFPNFKVTEDEINPVIYNMDEYEWLATNWDDREKEGQLIDDDSDWSEGYWRYTVELDCGNLILGIDLNYFLKDGKYYWFSIESCWGNKGG